VGIFHSAASGADIAITVPDPSTCDSFFASYDLAEVLRAKNFLLAFIDGLHLFEQALLDFIHLERFASRQSIIMIHDS
jgi:hypothetical protein